MISLDVKKRYSIKNLSMLPGYVIMVLWTVFIIIIIGWVCLASLATTRGIFTNNFFESGVHFENYISAFKDNKVGTYLFNSLIYTSVTLVGVIFIAAPASYVLSRFKFMGNKLLQSMFITALGIPGIMIILPLYSTATQLHLLNSRITLIIIYIATSVPFTLFFLLTFFANLPYSFEEAAAIDGCTPMKTFWLIMLPLATPGIVTVSIFNFIGIWNEFFTAYIFASNEAQRSLAVGVYNMMRSALYSGDWPVMFCGVVIIFVPTIILYMVLSEKIVSGVTGGAIKG